MRVRFPHGALSEATTNGETVMRIEITDDNGTVYRWTIADPDEQDEILATVHDMAGESDVTNNA